MSRKEGSGFSGDCKSKRSWVPVAPASDSTDCGESQPSDSFPGLISIVTGGTPRTTGVYYDASYDRKLVAPGQTTATPAGTFVAYDETIDFDLTRLDGGGGIDPRKLPRDPEEGFAPVYPHQFLRVNAIFEVIHEAGLQTAWSDKHPAYDIVNGPSVAGVIEQCSKPSACVKENTLAVDLH